MQMMEHYGVVDNVTPRRRTATNTFGSRRPSCRWHVRLTAWKPKRTSRGISWRSETAGSSTRRHCVSHRRVSCADHAGDIREPVGYAPT
jgi:hypothetical protein